MATTDLCWWELPAWISPGAALFVFLNVLLGTIAVTSRELPGVGTGSSRRRLCRSASSMVLDRLQSFSMFSVHPAAECYHSNTIREEDGQREMSGSASEQPVPEPARVDPRSVLAEEASMSETRKVAESSEKSTCSDDGWQGPTPESLSSAPLPVATATADEIAAVVERPRKKKPRSKVAAKRSKRQPAPASDREAEGAPEEKAELNARAELFIRQFREDLKLQRLYSITNYTRVLHH
ncbi:hypothetical protein QOZ80_8BG0658070 [Eleusine coracana subsp. coracana]|nr:hypothetical protein QOZ80_8BG0658070 [Eleusine coracana subsp. coracana]